MLRSGLQWLVCLHVARRGRGPAPSCSHQGTDPDPFGGSTGAPLPSQQPPEASTLGARFQPWGGLLCQYLVWKGRGFRGQGSQWPFCFPTKKKKNSPTSAPTFPPKKPEGQKEVPPLRGWPGLLDSRAWGHGQGALSQCPAPGGPPNPNRSRHLPALTQAGSSPRTQDTPSGHDCRQGQNLCSRQGLDRSWPSLSTCPLPEAATASTRASAGTGFPRSGDL